MEPEMLKIFKTITHLQIKYIVKWKLDRKKIF